MLTHALGLLTPGHDITLHARFVANAAIISALRPLPWFLGSAPKEVQRVGAGWPNARSWRRLPHKRKPHSAPLLATCHCQRCVLGPHAHKDTDTQAQTQIRIRIQIQIQMHLHILANIQELSTNFSSTVSKKAHFGMATWRTQKSHSHIQRQDTFVESSAISALNWTGARMYISVDADEYADMHWY